MKTLILLINRHRSIIIIASVLLFAINCISPFDPNFDGEQGLLAVDGSIVKGLDTQVIYISRSASIIHPQYDIAPHNPLGECNVKVVDNLGNVFVFKEIKKGKYAAVIDNAFLRYDGQYKLVIGTPTGDNYESSYQQLLQTPQVDSIYSIEENHYDTETEHNDINGFQFYVDINAPDGAPKHYMWKITETQELHSQYKIFGLYNGPTVKINIPSDSLYYCWKTTSISDIYTYSTVKLSHNIIKKIPLHYKLINSPDLSIKYCATVQQFALSEAAFNYWNQKEIELNESGQIYTTQPSQIKSNIVNTKKPNEQVLGFFWVSSCTEKHSYIVNPYPGSGANDCKSLKYGTPLTGEDLENFLLQVILFSKNIPAPPLYIYYVPPPIPTPPGAEYGFWCFALTNDCIDCRTQQGGTINKPSFWQ